MEACNVIIAMSRQATVVNDGRPGRSWWSDVSNKLCIWANSVCISIISIIISISISPGSMGNDKTDASRLQPPSVSQAKTSAE